MSLLTVSRIYKKYQDDVILNGISFTLDPFQKIAVAGETGCGKTTLMKIIGGLGQADSGEVYFDQAKVKGVNDRLMPGHPGIAYLSQHFELNNNYRAGELLAYDNKLSYGESAKLYAVCRIAHLLKRKTNTLSGGEKQRVALAKLLTHAPRLLLLDEPFSNMDLIHKNILKEVIQDIGQQLGITCMLISHDPQDILPWADEILVMKQGSIIQRGTPREIYGEPLTAYTAGLFGKYNLFSPAAASRLNISDGTQKFVRPEDLMILPYAGHGLRCTVAGIAYSGSHYETQIWLEDQIVTVRTNSNELKKGDTVWLRLK